MAALAQRAAPTAAEKPLKLVILGDGAVGKTCLLSRYTKDFFPQTYIPTVFDNCEKHCVLEDDREVVLSLWDTAGQEDYAHLRSMSFPGADGFVICFSATRKTSYDNVVSTWLPEVAAADAKVPCVLVRTKCDQSVRGSGGYVDHAMGASLANEYGIAYASTSALTGDGVEELFQAAARAALDHRLALVRSHRPFSMRRLSAAVLATMGLRKRPPTPKSAPAPRRVGLTGVGPA